MSEIGNYRRPFDKQLRSYSAKLTGYFNTSGFHTQKKFNLIVSIANSSGSYL